MTDALCGSAKTNLDAVFHALKEGLAPYDRDFDALFSAETRRLSRVHWTPVQVALCAAEMLATSPDTKILDIGCGPGKFCLIGAAMHFAQFYGIDLRQHLLLEGEAIAKSANINNVEFIHGNMLSLDWSLYSAFYLYNPFLENICVPAIIDSSVPVKFENFDLYVEGVKQRLTMLPLGTRVVTYHGFGGEMPDGYRLEVKKKIGTDFLECWVKVKNFDPDRPLAESF